MPSSEEEARAAELLEKLLSDSEFRASFRRDPAGACAAYDLPELVDEFSQGAGQGKALHTLEIRESRSSLAGAFMAAASESSGAVDHLKNLHDQHLHGGAHRVVGKALTAHHLHAVGAPGVHELVDSSGGGGVGGGGGAGVVHLADTQSVQSLLGNPHLALSPEAHAALVRGGADVRLVGVLDELSRDHNLRIGTLHVGHGGTGSIEILSVDGERVSQTNIAARDLANELASLDPSMRPGHIVTPWPIDSEGFSTSGAHEGRIQIVFDAPSAGHAPAVVEQSVAAAPVSTPVSAPEPATPTTPSTPSTPSTPAPAPSTPPPAPSTPPPDASTTPPAPSTPPPAPSTPPPSASTPPPEPSTPSTPPPAPSTPPPAAPPPPATPPPVEHTPPPVDPQGGDATPPADTSTPGPADTGTPPPAPSTPPPPAPATPPPPAPSTPPPAPSTPPPAPPAATTPPEPATPPVAPATPPPEPVTPATAPATGPSHQSVVIGAVGGATPADHQTASFQFVEQHPGSGGARDLASVGAFDPNAPGGLPDVSDTYPGDNAPKEQIAAWMGRQAHKAGLPAELPIMAGLTESGLTNVNYGDRDSLGFFQMRTSIWNQGEYAGFPDHPELQLKWFIDHALAVRQERIAQGDTSYGQDKSKWGDWVADVEQPAAEYRGRYATHLDQADQLLAQAGPPAGGSPDPAALVDAVGGVAGGGAAAPVALHALAVAESFKGTPYVWGGSNPQTGFDCSGLVQWSYHQAGIDLGRVTTDQFQEGVHIPTVDQLKPGDIVFFKDSTGYIHHEGIYIGNHQFLHAPHTGDVVKVSSLDEPYYAQQFAGGSDVSGLAHGAVPPPATVPPAVTAPPPPVEPATPAAPAAADATPAADTGGDGGAADDLFGAIEQQKGGSHSTVQILPAVQDPNAEQGS